MEVVTPVHGINLVPRFIRIEIIEFLGDQDALQTIVHRLLEIRIAQSVQKVLQIMLLGRRGAAANEQPLYSSFKCDA